MSEETIDITNVLCEYCDNSEIIFKDNIYFCNSCNTVLN